FRSLLHLLAYLCIVGIPVVVSFHITHEPTVIEERLSLPLGRCFWVLSLGCLFAGFGDYVQT
ncbi:hypothetical protein L873DRAFT_1750425, partial [Choiromyces venosus 120613-1]